MTNPNNIVQFSEFMNPIPASKDIDTMLTKASLLTQFPREYTANYPEGTVHRLKTLTRRPLPPSIYEDDIVFADRNVCTMPEGMVTFLHREETIHVTSDDLAVMIRPYEAFDGILIELPDRPAVLIKVTPATGGAKKTRQVFLIQDVNGEKIRTQLSDQQLLDATNAELIAACVPIVEKASVLATRMRSEHIAQYEDQAA